MGRVSQSGTIPTMNWIRNLFEDETPMGAFNDGLSQPEREAILDSLLYVMFTDHLITRDEDAVIKEAKTALNWESIQPIDSFMKVATARIRLASETDERESHFLKRVTRMTERPVAKKKLQNWLKRMIQADGLTAEEESDFLRKLATKRTQAIDLPRQSRILEAKDGAHL